MIMDESEFYHYCPFLEGYQEYLPCTYDPDMLCEECPVFASFRRPSGEPV